MKIINFKLHILSKIWICIKLKDNTSINYSLTNEINSHNLNTTNKIYKHILKLSNINTRKIYLYKIWNINRYNQKHINSCKN